MRTNFVKTRIIASDILHGNSSSPDLNCFVKCCNEEGKLLAVEKERLLSYYNNMCCKIDAINTNLSDLSKSKHAFFGC